MPALAQEEDPVVPSIQQVMKARTQVPFCSYFATLFHRKLPAKLTSNGLLQIYLWKDELTKHTSFTLTGQNCSN